MANFKRIPSRVNVRVKKSRGCYYALARNGRMWKVIDKTETRNEALEFIEQYHTDKDVRWSTDVKIRAGWVCEEPNCGELDKELLDSDHIKPRATYPELAHDLENGKCRCLRCHAQKHKKDGEMMAYYLIMERLALVLYRRLYPHKKAEIQRMAG